LWFSYFLVFVFFCFLFFFCFVFFFFFFFFFFFLICFFVVFFSCLRFFFVVKAGLEQYSYGATSAVNRRGELLAMPDVRDRALQHAAIQKFARSAYLPSTLTGGQEALLTSAVQRYNVNHTVLRQCDQIMVTQIKFAPSSYQYNKHENQTQGSNNGAFSFDAQNRNQRGKTPLSLPIPITSFHAIQRNAGTGRTAVVDWPPGPQFNGKTVRSSLKQSPSRIFCWQTSIV